MVNSIQGPGGQSNLWDLKRPQGQQQQPPLTASSQELLAAGGKLQGSAEADKTELAKIKSMKSGGHHHHHNHAMLHQASANAGGSPEQRWGTPPMGQFADS